MKDKKNIERLFQEKFKDFDQHPPLDAWKNIENRLQNKKKKRRIIPIWLKSTGIAAGILIAIGLFNFFNNQSNVYIKQAIDETNTPTVFKNNNTNETYKENTNKLNLQDKVNSSNNENEIIKGNEIVTQKNANINSNDLIISKTNQPIVLQNKTNKKKESNYKVNSKNSTFTNGVFNQNSDNANLLSSEAKVQLLPLKKPRLNASSKNKNAFMPNDIQFNESIIDELVVANNKNENIDDFQSNNSSKNEEILPALVINDDVLNATTILDTNKINHVLVTNENIQDSAAVVVEKTEQNELEKLLLQKEDGENADEKEKEKRSKWVISTNAAPVYFNSFSEGSPLDAQFTSNDKSYNTSVSYGVGLGYNLSSKWTIRSGINKFDMSYSTQDVYFSPVLKTEVNNYSMNTLQVSRNSNSQYMLFYNKTEDTFGDVENFSSDEKGNLNQEISYYEVPLELTFKVLDKKFGVNLIGGMSTLILQRNTVVLESSGLQMQIGEANNLNKLNFSGNIGVGFRYSFWKSFNANFEPVLKYQFNTFNDNAGNFKPYIVGLYTGLSYSF